MTNQEKLTYIESSLLKANADFQEMRIAESSERIQKLAGIVGYLCGTLSVLKDEITDEITDENT